MPKPILQSMIIKVDHRFVIVWLLTQLAFKTLKPSITVRLWHFDILLFIYFYHIVSRDEVINGLSALEMV